MRCFELPRLDYFCDRSQPSLHRPHLPVRCKCIPRLPPHPHCSPDPLSFCDTLPPYIPAPHVIQKVENAQLEHEIKAAGIHLPQDNWIQEMRETVPEEPLPEYLAALWDFAEGKSHSPKAASGTSTTTTLATPPATPRAHSRGVAVRQSRQTSSSSSSSSSSACTMSSSWSASASSSSSCTSANSSANNSANSTQQRGGAASTAVSKEPPRSPSPPSASSNRTAAVLAAAANAVANSTPGQALEDATALCAFMEAAQTRSAKRARVAPGSQQQQQQQQREGGSNLESAKQQPTQPRGWSDHGSTTSESRGGSEFSEEDSAFERKSTDGSGASSSIEAGAVLSPAFWTSRQVLERYVLPRQQLLQG